MADTTPDRTPLASTLKRIALPLALTRIGLLAERLARAFWPLWSLLIAVLAVLMLGLHDMATVETVWVAAVVAVLAGLWFLVRGVMTFRWPSREDAFQRLDTSLVGRPLTALRDAQVMGGNDSASVAMWRAHQSRMAARAATAKAVEPDLRVSSFDPFGMRYVALTALCIALLFGSFWRVGTVAGMAPGGGSAMAAGPSWEGWVEPPAYTGLPVIYLNDIEAGPLKVAQGSRVTLRLYGEVGALSVTEGVSGRIGELPDPAPPSQDFAVAQDGPVSVEGPNGRAWDIAVLPDAAPEVEIIGPAEASYEGQMTLPFRASDDYGVEGGEAVITLDLDRIDRRYGLALDPEPREALTIPMPVPISGSRAEFEEALIEDFSKHPWANMPVRIDLVAQDAAGQEGMVEGFEIDLAARRFFDPLASAVIEMRRDLLWNLDNGKRVAQVLKAVSWRPEGLFRSETAYLRLRTIMRRLDTMTTHASFTPETRDEIAEALWELALELEEGDIGDAMERMRAAQEKLSEAMKNGASDQEIARLMQELRDATQDYLRQLSRQAQQDAEQNGQQQQQAQNQNGMQMNQDDLQRMMDRIQELMEQGRMAEAQQALEELQQLMENMRVTQGQGGEGQSPGDQAMEGLSETLRNQQGLSDQAFRDLQEQYNPGANQGQSQGNQGQSGNGMGQGQQHGEGQGQGQNGQQQGQGNDQPGGQAQGGSNGEDFAKGDLAQRQQQLRQELERQRGNLPNIGGEAGDRAGEALNRAEDAMRGAEDALRNDDLAGAIDRQAEAMDALREGMRNLGEALAEQQREMRGGQGEAQGNAGGQRNDPLGRNAGTNGQLGNEENMLQGEDVYRRARDLLDEIRRRSGQGDRPDVELDYLKRLLERF